MNMKKYFALPIAALLCLLSLAGCKAGISSKLDADEFPKAQRIAAIDASGAERAVLETEADIDAFVEAVNIEDWHMEELPEGLQKGGAFILYQTETITAFMGDREAEIQEICTFQCYQDAPYLTVDVGIVDLSIHFSIPQETADYLQGILEG